MVKATGIIILTGSVFNDKGDSFESDADNVMFSDKVIRNSIVKESWAVKDSIKIFIITYSSRIRSNQTYLQKP